MRKYLHITEYSSLIPYKLPCKKDNEFDLKIDNNIIRTSVNNYKTCISESYLSDDITLLEQTIPLDNIIIYDDIDNLNEDQKLAYVYECPICLNTTITSKKLDFCPHCENTKFSPEVIALISTNQMEDIALNQSDVSTLYLIKDDKVILKDKQKDSIN